MLKSLFTARLSIVIISVVSTVIFASKASALNFDEYSGYDLGGYHLYGPIEPPPRTYKSAQGHINLDDFEALLSAQLLGVSVQILDVRWPYNPVDYTNYFIGSAVAALTEAKDAKFGTYVISLRVDGKHEGQCELNLFPGLKKGRIHQCESPTSKIRLHHDFDYASVGLY